MAGAEEPDQAAILDKMGDHWVATLRALHATIGGDPEAAAKEAAKLDRASAEGIPDVWKTGLAKVQAAGKDMGNAKDVAGAAQAFTKISQACADCHTTLEAELTVVADDLSGENKWVPEIHMSRHYWGAYAMWMGVVGPSPVLYGQGARALAEQEPLESMKKAGKVGKLDKTVHDLAKKAASAETAARRAELFTEIITTCGTCHSAMQPEAWKR